MRRWLFLVFLWVNHLVYGCGTPDMTLRSLSSDQPYVLQATPMQEEIPPDTLFHLSFSRPLDLASIDEKAVLVVEGQFSFEPYKSMSKMIQEIEEGKIASHPVLRQLSEEKSKLAIQPRIPLQPGAWYSLVVTSRLMTEDQFSFNQTPADSATPFVKYYYVLEEGASPKGSGGKAPAGNLTGSSSTSSKSSPDRPPPQVTLNEIYYDAVGSDTDGVLFVELKGKEGEDLSDLQVLFVNGDDGKISDSFVLPSGSVIKEGGLFVIADSSTGSSTSSRVTTYDFLDNFDPQNGPDAVQLVFNGEILDALAYGPVTVTTAENGLSLVEGSPAVPVPSGHSLSRTEGAADTNDNSVDFVENTIPSPGTSAVTRK
ncbi:MAG: hypothetical protein HYS22_01400 [Deltaproteobacteria bacterium]|nr:hypothetical protein [Deltaproteobacteria bacterium]